MSLYIDDDGYWCWDWEVPQNEQLPNDTKRPYCCPVCQGRLTMPAGFYEGYGEIVGGSQRETDIEKLKQGHVKEGENSENYEWYLDLRRYGGVPHSGFGMGVERVIAWICGIDNIKDTIPFPRTMLRKTP